MKFSKTFCSQCGGEFGPRNSGFSHCADHKYVPRLSKLESLQNYTGNLLVSMVHLLDDADPKSPAAIRARELLKEEIL